MKRAIKFAQGILTRMSIDVLESDHKKIKAICAKKGISIREFVLDCIEEQVKLRKAK